jgi:hypothetical protein
MAKKLSTPVKNLIREPAYALLGPLLYDKLQFYRANSYWPDYKNPRSFNEYMGHYKFHNPPRQIEVICDKWAVREVVKARVGEHILNDVYYAGTDPDTVPWDTLPQRFFAKGTHGSGSDYAIRVEDKSRISFDEFRARAKKILALKFGRLSNEAWYQKITPRIIIEKFLDDEKYLVSCDYKFLAFHGKVRVIAVMQDRFGDAKATFYDENWNRTPFTMKFEPGPDLPRPDNLAEMIAISERLAQGYDFLRVDLYNHHGNKIVFGELTPCYGAGWDRFKPDSSYDFALGRYIKG